MWIEQSSRSNERLPNKERWEALQMKIVNLKPLLDSKDFYDEILQNPIGIPFWYAAPQILNGMSRWLTFYARKAEGEWVQITLDGVRVLYYKDREEFDSQFAWLKRIQVSKDKLQILWIPWNSDKVLETVDAFIKWLIESRILLMSERILRIQMNDPSSMAEKKLLEYEISHLKELLKYF